MNTPGDSSTSIEPGSWALPTWWPPLSLGRKLALAFLGFLLLTAGNLFLADCLYDSTGGIAQIVNDTGRLRYLSQKMAYLATRLDAGDRETLGEAIGQYENMLDAIDRRLDVSGQVLLGYAPDLRQQRADLRLRWDSYRRSLETVRRLSLNDVQAQEALARLHRSAEPILIETDILVDGLVAAEARIRQRLHRQLAAGFALEGTFLLAVFLFLQRRVSRPVRRLSQLCDDFAAGEYSVRVAARSRDEIGDLALAINRTAATTEALIRELNKRTQESTLLHRIATLLQDEDATSAQVLQRVAQLLPAGWQYPEVAVARIAYGDAEYQTLRFRETAWRQAVEFRCSAGKRTRIEICYLESRPEADEGPFRREERSLLQAVADMLRPFLDSLNSRRGQARLFAIVEETPDLVASFGPDGRTTYLNRAAMALLGVDHPEGADINACYPEWVKTIQTKAAMPTAAKNGLWQGEIAVRTADGRDIPLSQILIAHKALDGTVSHYSMIAHDISDRIRMEDRLTQSRDFYLSLLHDFPDPILRTDGHGGCDYFNRAWLEFTGLPLDRQRGDGWLACLHAEDRQLFAAALARGLEQHESFEIEYRLRRRDGEYRWMLAHGAPFRDPAGGFAGFVVCNVDISGRKEAESALSRSQEHLRTLYQAVEQSGSSVVITDVRGTIEYVNPYFCKVTGYAADEAVGQNPRLLKSGNKTEEEYRQFWRAITAGEEWRGEFLNRRKDGELYWESAVVSPVRGTTGDITHFVAVKEDITLRKRMEEELELLANFDSLTGLPNRNLLMDRLEQALAFARRHQSGAAILFLDLDHFKRVNDTLSHATGDELLVAVAGRLRGCLREGDTVARLGGDEFVVVLPDAAADEAVDHVAQMIQERLARPFQVGGQELFVSASIGVSLFPRDGDDIQALLKNADTAMYRAKEEGRGNHQFYAAEMNARAFERLSMEASLRRALERGEFLLHYQPQVDLATGRIVSAEALVRWQHPDWGLVSPARFIPLAEETGMIVPIGEWVLRAACAQTQAWHDADLPPIRVAVNLSARQLRQPDLVGLVADALATTGLDGEYLNLELTESMLMDHQEQVIAILRELKGLGVRFSLDDFGTGYSSLGYLKRFPIDEVKIDQAFVRDITHNPEDAAIARAVIGIAESLHLQVIAEGVETEGQLNFLRRGRCHQIQGYYFSRPLPAEEFGRLLAENRHLETDEARPPRTLLIVDDEQNIINALRRILRQEDYRILATTDAREGMELLAQHDVQVVLCDQRMPGMTGTEFLSRVRELHPDTVRIVLSGYTDFKAVTDAINRGAIYKFFSKPWEDELLRQNIREAFVRHEAAIN